ncbi:DUF1146 domain-containing protein [Paenibacillus albicereus]|uniref:DUF1146 domain-containing protein n=1 Tax=Paenibacillus albicereus TaxID=2726185 RepID=A0A6H2H293_9BACL|nr:DUF1146 domain-containing protein [Paenibacillus albicereus]QJC53814.1 DUF1146 domain-containing protein [Paenibacillus albicereus]
MNSNQGIGEAFSSIGLVGLFSIVITICSILLAWYLLQELKLDHWFKHPRSPRARVLIAVLAVILGHLFARFILDYWSWTNVLKLI